MRFSFVVMAAACAALPFASPAVAKGPSACTINERAGSAATTRLLPNEGRARNRIALGTDVEIVTVANDRNGCPWALVREPGQLFTNWGWADRRLITCR